MYLRRFAEALAPVADLLVVTTDETAERITDVPAELVSLGPTDRAHGGRFTRRGRATFATEIDRFQNVAGRVDRAIHMFADHRLERLAWAPRAKARTSIVLFYPRAHYPRRYHSRLEPRDRVAAFVQEISLRRWRRRPDADVVWTLDECAARSWERRRGATAAWLPEPPVGELETAEAEDAREGCVLYGALTTYKGIDRIVRAFTTTPTELPLTLAGYVEPEYRLELDRQIELLKAAGVRLDLRDHIHSEEEGVRVLSRARCVVLPYHRHAGMSRVLLEAAVARTPIVVHDYGLLAHLARTEGIGVTVDADDPVALRTAVTRFAEDPELTRSYAAALERFAERYSRAAFVSSLRGPLALESSAESLVPTDRVRA